MSELSSIKIRVSVLYFGDIAPMYLTGTAMSAKYVMEDLGRMYNILHIPEGDKWSSHGKLSTRKIYRFLRSVRSIVRISKECKPDIFYMHLPSSLRGLSKTLCLILVNRIFSGSKIILHLHRGDYSKQYEKSVMFRLATRAIDRVTNRILVLSENHLKAVKKIFVRSRLFIVENTTVVLPKYRGRESKGLYTFLFLSNYIREKGVLDLLKVFRRILNERNDAQLRLRGNTFDSKFLAILSSYQDGSSIVLDGPVSGSEKLREICNADCLILPSWNEGQPLVILEAMAMGVPVIATDVGFVRETLGEKYPYLIPPRDENALLESIQKFIRDKRKEEIGRQLKERFESKYSREQHRRKILKAFAEVCPP